MRSAKCAWVFLLCVDASYEPLSLSPRSALARDVFLGFLVPSIASAKSARDVLLGRLCVSEGPEQTKLEGGMDGPLFSF